MLHKITSFEDLDPRKLMDLYQEGNEENADYFYPEMADKSLAVKKCEDRFLDFLKTDFFPKSGSEYWILEREGVWVSALRLSRISDGFYYIEALETHPEFRKKGYAVLLLNGVIDDLKQRGPFVLCDSVKKTNIPSIRTHQKCGFEIVSEAAMDYLANETSDRHYGMRYSYQAASDNQISSL